MHPAVVLAPVIHALWLLHRQCINVCPESHYWLALADFAHHARLSVWERYMYVHLFEEGPDVLAGLVLFEHELWELVKLSPGFHQPWGDLMSS
jgi:hypothetical protein